jgi:hypothetical protein
MSIDWVKLAREVGSLRDDGESGGTRYAQLALERILGEANIRHAVDLILDAVPGAELTMNVLQHIMSWQATEMAHEAYKTASGARASMAVWLIKHIAHPQALPWVQAFLLDDAVAGWGIGLLDQLLWTYRVEPEAVEDLLVQAERHHIENVREQTAFIRSYLKERQR